jgi:hypothetical protein
MVAHPLRVEGAVAAERWPGRGVINGKVDTGSYGEAVEGVALVLDAAAMSWWHC